MNGEPEPGRWPRRRWYAYLALVFGLQLGLIFLLSDRKPLRVRPTQGTPRLAFAAPAMAELWALKDPTLLALPNAHGFSASAWLKVPRLSARQFDWSEPTNWLALSPAQLGHALGRVIEPPALNALASIVLSEPETMPPEVSSAALPVLPERSTWQLAGDLSLLRLQNGLSVTNPAHTDWLTNSIVLLTVGPDGKPFSVPILLAGSGSKAVDDYALFQAGLLRFEPAVNRPLDKKPDLVFGKVIFEWATVPIPATNPVPVLQP